MSEYLVKIFEYLWRKKMSFALLNSEPGAEENKNNNNLTKKIWNSLKDRQKCESDKWEKKLVQWQRLRMIIKCIKLI